MNNGSSDNTLSFFDEVVTTLTMMMNLCNSFKQMTNATLLLKSISKNQIDCNDIQLNASRGKK